MSERDAKESLAAIYKIPQLKANQGGGANELPALPDTPVSSAILPTPEQRKAAEKDFWRSAREQQEEAETLLRSRSPEVPWPSLQEQRKQLAEVCTWISLPHRDAQARVLLSAYSLARDLGVAFAQIKVALENIGPDGLYALALALGAEAEANVYDLAAADYERALAIAGAQELARLNRDAPAGAAIRKGQRRSASERRNESLEASLPVLAAYRRLQSEMSREPSARQVQLRLERDGEDPPSKATVNRILKPVRLPR